MRSADEFDEVQHLVALGMNDCAISRLTGIPRPTIRGRRRDPPPSLRKPWASSPCGVLHDFAALPPGPYAYLLGLYLGDGCLSRMRRVWKLRIALDTRYPAIAERCRQAIDLVMPGQRALVFKRPSENCADVSLYSKHGPCLFPQHGPGRKHHRSIRYHFSNRSEDILGLFTAALDRLGIHWTRSTKYIVSVYRKADTARLDEFVGPKDRAVPWTNVHYTA
jgi:hypothetical protein